MDIEKNLKIHEYVKFALKANQNKTKNTIPLIFKTVIHSRSYYISASQFARIAQYFSVV